MHWKRKLRQGLLPLLAFGGLRANRAQRLYCPLHLLQEAASTPMRRQRPLIYTTLPLGIGSTSDIGPTNIVALNWGIASSLGMAT